MLGARCSAHLEGALRVDALRVLVAAAVVAEALVHVPAADAVAGEAILAATRMGTLRPTVY